MVSALGTPEGIRTPDLLVRSAPVNPKYEIFYSTSFINTAQTEKKTLFYNTYASDDIYTLHQINT